MPGIELRRRSLGRLFDSAACPHAGLWLSRGLEEWKQDPTKKGEELHQHVRRAASIAVSDIYEQAYQRWERIVTSAPTMATWAGRLEGRLFIGLGGATVIETAINLSRTYGAPVIPGSAQKGLVRAYAEIQCMEPGAVEILFGKTGERPEDSDAGYVIFHDAWWVPGSAETPLAQEIVTVHHPEYYKSAGAQEATDFDSPVPNAQIAIRGGFLFAVECASHAWADFARDVLARALSDWGIGGKTAAGYGRFRCDVDLEAKLAKAREDAAIAGLPPDQRLRAEIAALTPDDLAKMLGKDRNRTRELWSENWDARLVLVIEIHGELIRAWEKSPNTNEKKAFKAIFRQIASDY